MALSGRRQFACCRQVPQPTAPFFRPFFSPFLLGRFRLSTGMVVNGMPQGLKPGFYRALSVDINVCSTSNLGEQRGADFPDPEQHVNMYEITIDI